MSIENEAELLIAMRSYKCDKRKKRTDGFDFSASDSVSHEKILLRSIEPQAKAGFIGVDDVKKMLKEMKSKEFDRGVIIGKRFTAAATEEMATKKIQHVSSEYAPPFKPEDLYLTITTRTNDLCIVKCGNAPLKSSDCKTSTDGKPCRIREISEDASFHFNHGWLDLMKNDLKQLLALHRAIKVK
jgi:hypothetical protein